jgi:hypothetical protein
MHPGVARSLETPTFDLPATASGLAWLMQPAAQHRPPTISRLTILGLQRSVGNAVVARAIRPAIQRSQRAGPSLTSERVQRDDLASVPVTGVTLSASKVSVPAESGLTLKATAAPGKATGVTFSVSKGSVSPTGVTIDATTGVITLAAGQQGGTVTIKATSDDGSWASSDLRIIEKPVAITSTSASSAGGSQYGGRFTHTWSAPSGQASGLQGSNINETFDALKAQTPFGAFTLAANAAGSPGWDLDSSGTMAGPDNVAIDKSMIDVGKFVKSASNPSPANSLPVGFTMVQHMHTKSLPSGTRDSATFADVNHVRTLTDKETFVVTAGLNHTDDAYTGPAAFTNAKASPTSVNASPAKPKKPSTATWARTKVQVTADVIPAAGSKVFSIVGAKLGCEIDATSGEVLIGDQVGTITVRVSAGASGHNFDEVTITIVAAPVAPTPTPGQPKPTSETGETGAAGEAVAE